MFLQFFLYKILAKYFPKRKYPQFYKNSLNPPPPPPEMKS